MRQNSGDGFIYFVTLGDSVKIVHSYDVEARMVELQREAPSRLDLWFKVKGTRTDEKRLHLTFLDFKLYGEWHYKGRPLRRFVDDCRRANRLLRNRMVPYTNGGLYPGDPKVGNLHLKYRDAKRVITYRKRVR